MNRIKSIAACAVVAAAWSTANANPGTVDWAAAIDNGFGLADGTDLTNVNLTFLRLGTFTNLTDSQITANGTNLSFLNSFFIELDTSSIGQNVGDLPAHFADSGAGNLTSLGLVGKQIFMWVFATNSANFLQAEQHGIFYLNMATNQFWKFPTDAPGSDYTSIDISDLTLGDSALVDGATILWGGFGVGTSDYYPTSPLFNLATVAIPEPSTYGLITAGIGLFVFLARRRRA